MKYKLHWIDLYIIFWAAYHIGLYFQISGSAYFLIITLIWSFYDMACLFYQQREKSPFLIAYTVFFLMLFFYGLFLAVGGEYLYSIHGRMSNTQYIQKVTVSLLPFYTFYRGFVEKKIVLSKAFYWIIPFFAVAISGYYMQLGNALQIINGFADDDVDEVVNNGSYLILGLVPFVCLAKKRIIHLLCFAVCFYLILTAYKRGPIVIFFVCMTYYFLNSTKLSSKRIGTTLLVIVAFSMGFLFFTDFFEGSDLLQERWTATIEGSSSGRDSISSLMLDVFMNSNIIQLLFGHGAYGTLSLTRRLAHNDWLQILVDQGVIGISVFVFFCWCLIKQWKTSDNSCNAKKSYGMFLIIFLLTSIVSMAFDRIPLYEMVVMSAVVAQNDLKTSCYFHQG